MNVALETIDVWSFEGEFSPEKFFLQLRGLLQDGDVLALGAYGPSAKIAQRLDGLGATQKDASVIYRETFWANRREHPDGRSFELLMSDALLSALVDEASRNDGQTDKPLFFDHFMAYRRGKPVIPLLCFHDAFYGGELHLSGLYSEAAVRDFAVGLPSAFARRRNPALPEIS